VPEALAILFIFSVAALVYLIAHACMPATNREEEKERLQQRHRWLQERLQSAESENWDTEMRTNLAQQVADTQRRLDQLS